MKVSSTERLELHLMADTDAELLYELDQNPNVMKYINGGKLTSMEDIEKVMIPRMNSYRNPPNGWGLWKVLKRNDKQFIGWILVRPMDFFNDSRNDNDIELGWRFKQESWGKGYATEAAEAVMTALIDLGIYEKMSVIVVPGNQASIRIMQKLGMKYLKTDIHKDPLGDMEVEYYSRDC